MEEEKLIVDGDQKFKVLSGGKYYRLTNITCVTSVQEGKLHVTHLPIENGIAVEEKIEGGSYQVIAFLYLEKNEIQFEGVGLRTVDTLKGASQEKRGEYISIMESAKALLLKEGAE